MVFTPDALAMVSAATLAFSLLTYILLDGTDLGVGIWLGMTPDPADRHRLTLSILPIWDANETWLVLLLGGMLALFPAAYSAFLTAALVPAIIMVMALVMRGGAVEFRQVAKRPWLCDAAIFAGSLIAALFQGILFGTVIQGIPGSAAAPESGVWCTPFTLFSGGVLVALNIDVIVPFIERLLGVQFLSKDIYLISTVPSDLRWPDVFKIGGVSVLLAFVATLYPSWSASRVKPAEALRYE